MYKRLLILALHFVLILFILREASSLILVYFLLSPLLILPAFYFYKEAAWFFFGITVLTILGLFVKYAAIDLWPEFLLFGIFQPFLFMMLMFYFGDLRFVLREATVEKEEIRTNLENLKAKFRTRLTSLKHLEQQVGSLMNLFEIARDFSECMDFATLTEFLLKKLGSELAFQRMRIFLALKSEGEGKAGLFKVYDMAVGGVNESERPLNKDEKDDFDLIMKSKSMVRHDRIWYFPIFEGERMGAVFSIEGVKEDKIEQHRNRIEIL